MRGRVLRLVPLGEPVPDPPLLDWLGAELARNTGVLPVLDRPFGLPPPEPGGGRSSDRVLDDLIDRFPPPGDDPPRDWTLAVTAAELVGGNGRRVFGEATVGGGWAVVGLGPLLPPDPWRGEEALRHRLLVESLHELGHVAGLEHCGDPGCAMSASPDVESVDAKEARYCGRCRASVEALAPPPGQG